jgi:hypothetical protein
MQAHSDEHKDALFHEPFMATLAGLTGYRLDRSDGARLACLCFGDGCDFGAKSIPELGIHPDRHPSEGRISLEYLGVFWGPVICSSIKNGTWPTIGTITLTRLPEVLSRLHPLDSEEAFRYWARSTEAEDDDEAKAE